MFLNSTKFEFTYHVYMAIKYNPQSNIILIYMVNEMTKTIMMIRIASSSVVLTKC